MARAVGTGSVEFFGRERIYDIFSRDLRGAPRFFIAYNRGNVILSEEIPEMYREFMVLHELQEFEELQGKKGRCLEALKFELKHVPREIRGEYVIFRRETFSELLTYFEKQDGGKDFIGEVRSSFEHLNSIINGSSED